VFFNVISIQRIVTHVREGPRSSSAHLAPGKKATVPIWKVLIRPGRESNFRPTAPKRTHQSPDNGLVWTLHSTVASMVSTIAHVNQANLAWGYKIWQLYSAEKSPIK